MPVTEMGLPVPAFLSRNDAEPNVAETESPGKGVNRQRDACAGALIVKPWCPPPPSH